MSLYLPLAIALYISTQGTQIHSDKVLQMLDNCENFVRSNIGYRILTMSEHEILEENKRYYKRTGQRVSPLFEAYASLEDLQKSRLKYDRKEKHPKKMFLEISNACQQLERDFDNRSKWH